MKVGMDNFRKSTCRKYSSKNPLVRFLVHNFLRTIADLVESVAPQKILDVGCGEGFVIRHLLVQNEKLIMEGIDRDEDSLKIASKLNPQANFKVGSIYNLPFEENSFDLVICLEVLEHLDAPSKALVELKRVTNKYCLISVPHEPLFRISNFLRGKNITRFGNDPEHIQHWTKKEFRRLMEEYFKVRRMVTPFPWVAILGEI